MPRRVSAPWAVTCMLVLLLTAAAERRAISAKEKAPEGHAPTDSASVAAGHKLFLKYCVPCHGVNGRGDGPTAKTLNPKPRDFTSPKNFKSKNDDEVFNVISKGGAQNKLSPVMPPWGSTFKKQQIWQLIAYVRGFPERDSLRRAAEAK